MGAKREGYVNSGFVFRVKLDEFEVELAGSRDEVMKTLEDLPRLMSNVQRAFDVVKPRKFASLTVKTDTVKEDKGTSQKYPRISAAGASDEAVLKLLKTEWGKWRPRTVEELGDALKANGLEYHGRMLAAVLLDLVKQEKVRRWNTDSGYVYILAEKEALGVRRGANEQS